MTYAIDNNIGVKVVSPPWVTSKGIRCACSLDKTSLNFSKSATLLRVRNSRSLSFRSRDWTVSTMCCLWGHVMQPTSGLASSVTKAVFVSRRSNRWTPFTDSVRIRAVSKGRTSPNSAPISVVEQENRRRQQRLKCTAIPAWLSYSEMTPTKYFST